MDVCKKEAFTKTLVKIATVSIIILIAISRKQGESSVV
jgi:hypothetical protein